MDVLSLECEYQRECCEARPSGFKWIGDNYVQVVEHIIHKSGNDGLESTIPFPTSKQGCTCGKCELGYLSPRMHFRWALGKDRSPLI